MRTFPENLSSNSRNAFIQLRGLNEAMTAVYITQNDFVLNVV